MVVGSLAVEAVLYAVGCAHDSGTGTDGSKSQGDWLEARHDGDWSCIFVATFDPSETNSPDICAGHGE